MNGRSHRAFTLTELLVTIGIIAILVALLLTVLSRGKSKAQRVACINNLRQLMLIWHKYPTDNDDRLVLNYRPIGLANLGRNNPALIPWVSGDYHYEYDTVTNLAYLNDPTLSAFASQLNSPLTYRCPGIKHKVAGVDEIRSYGLNQYVGAGRWSSTVRTFTRFQRLDDIASPSEIYVFRELNPHSICTSMARVPMDTNNVTDYYHYPSFHHNNRTIMSFADGHVDMQLILDPHSLRQHQVDWLPDHVADYTNPDVVWARAHTTYPR